MKIKKIIRPSLHTYGHIVYIDIFNPHYWTEFYRTGSGIWRWKNNDGFSVLVNKSWYEKLEKMFQSYIKENNYEKNSN